MDQLIMDIKMIFGNTISRDERILFKFPTLCVYHFVSCNLVASAQEAPTTDWTIVTKGRFGHPVVGAFEWLFPTMIRTPVSIITIYIEFQVQMEAKI